MKDTPSSSYYPLFDLLRFVLATDVLLYHSGVLKWAQSGNLAVQVFFSLSGWLIGAILCNTKPEDLAKFYFARTARIWIPYFSALSLIIIISSLRDQINMKWLEFVFYKITFVYNIFGTPQLNEFLSQMPLKGTGNHLWSINAEEQFYLLAPLLLVTASRFGGRSILIWFLISVLAWKYNIYTSIIFGVLASVIRSHYPVIFDKKSARIIGFLAAVIAALGIYRGYDYLALSPFFSVSIVIMLAIKGRRNSILDFLGGISYPLYLINWIGLFTANFITSSLGLRETTLGLLLGIVASYAAATIHYIYIDKNIKDIRDSVYTKKLGYIALITGYSMVTAGFIGHYVFSSIHKSSP